MKMFMKTLMIMLILTIVVAKLQRKRRNTLKVSKRLDNEKKGLILEGFKDEINLGTAVDIARSLNAISKCFKEELGDREVFDIIEIINDFNKDEKEKANIQKRIKLNEQSQKNAVDFHENEVIVRSFPDITDHFITKLKNDKSKSFNKAYKYMTICIDFNDKEKKESCSPLIYFKEHFSKENKEEKEDIIDYIYYLNSIFKGCKYVYEHKSIIASLKTFFSEIYTSNGNHDHAISQLEKELITLQRRIGKKRIESNNVDKVTLNLMIPKTINFCILEEIVSFSADYLKGKIDSMEHFIDFLVLLYSIKTLKKENDNDYKQVGEVVGQSVNLMINLIGLVAKK